MTTQRKHLYEGMYILSATLSDDARQKALEKVSHGISSRNGEVHKVFDQGRKKLSYQIDGRREGYYYLLYFSLPTGHINDLWREYHLNEDMVRFITLRAERVPEKIEFKTIVQE
jgi:small subunit ribosomal protein S6